MALLRPFLKPDSLEDVFLERYDDLLRVALGVTGGRREAEDLVQEAFVRFVLAAPDLGAIVNLDGYLRTVVRNLHAAGLRRRAQRAESPLSIADFDTAPFAARALTPSQWTQARHDVVAACRYACTRRLTSKSGSVFLLRFVHEFVPSDIALIARLSRANVDVTILRARAEVKTYLESPARALKALGRDLVPMTMPIEEQGADDDEDYLARVRAAVFALRHGRCFDAAQLRRWYASTDESAIPTQILAELVTCSRCLDEVSRLLRLPPCAERHPDVRRPPTGDSSRRAAPRDANYARRAAAAQTSRLVRAHRPRELRMLINGFEIGTHEINGGASRITQTLSILEPVWLAEVYSEQEVCLASLDVTPLPDAPAEQRVHVRLSDDRQIALTLSLLKPWPTLSLVYEDPGGAARAAAAAIVSDAADASDLTGAAAHAAATIEPGASPRHVLDTWRDWARDFSRNLLRRPPRLAWGTAIILIAGWLFFFTPGTSVSAAERLWRAIVELVTRAPAPAPMPPGGPTHRQDIPLSAPIEPRAPVAAPAPPPLTQDLLAELEIDALTVLQKRHALVGQRIQVKRMPAGVAVEGLVEGLDRAEIVRALREVPHSAALSLRLSKPGELSGSSPKGSSPASNLRVVTLGRDAIPVADDLRQAIARRNPAADTNVEAEMRRLADQGLQAARTAFLEAATLSTLADRFAVLSGAPMPDTAAKKWRALLREQTDRVARPAGEVRALLEPAFVREDEPPPRRSAPAIGDADRLAGEARQVAEDLRQVERAARVALTVSETAPNTIELRDAAFWRRLAATRERLLELAQHWSGQ